jgi:hypothetical protein
MIRNARVIRVRRAIRDPAAALRRLAGRAARVAR